MNASSVFDDTAELITLCPGHIRISVPRLYHSDTEKEEIERTLSAQPEISEAYANPLTGKVLIHFDPAIVCDEILSSLGLAPKPEKTDRFDASRPVSAGPRIRPDKVGPGASASVAKQRSEGNWHLMPQEDVLSHFGSSASAGLDSALVDQRLRHGLNVLPQKEAPSALAMFLGQFTGLPVVLLGVSAVLSALTGGIGEAVAIVAVLGMNAGIGYATERRAEQTIASLSELVDESVPVIRDGRPVEVASSHIATGDLLVMLPGVHVAADARLVQDNGLLVDESALTGESRFVSKTASRMTGAAPLAERSNMVYMGTAIAAGRGLAVVTATGPDTELGWVQTLVSNAEPPKTPIQRQLDDLGNRLVMISMATCGLVFAVGLLRGRTVLEMLKASISLAIAAVPEGLPTVATTSFARGLRIMREREMLIRKLQAIETLGAIHTVCFDKTGTLTLNRMSAVALETPSGTHINGSGGALQLRQTWDHQARPDLGRILEICVLSNENGLAEDGSTSLSNGSATENALRQLAADAGISAEQVREQYPLLDIELRAEGRKYMKTVHAVRDADTQLVAIKGSPLEVLDLCSMMHKDDSLVLLTEQSRARIRESNAGMAARQLRVLGFAYAERNQPEADNGDAEESMPARTDAKDLIWLGLVGLADPIRQGVDKVIADFHRAGIRTVMLTGDQRATAQAIGDCVGLSNNGALHVLDSDELETSDPAVLPRQVSEADVFARISPARKLQIVQTLQKSGDVVAMTGDGINDGPALRAADIGIAMGLHGTNLARSAASVVLKDDRLDTVLDAIRQGRTITKNIEKSLEFLISSNLSEILTVFSALSITGGTPLTPMQLLWINLLGDVLPAVALAAEPPEGGVMEQPPRDTNRPLVGKPELLRYTRQGAWLTGGSLAAYMVGVSRYGVGTRSSGIAFNALMLGQLLHALSCRSRSSGKALSGDNARSSMLDRAVFGSIALQLAANVLPFLRTLLRLGQGISLSDVVTILAGAVIPFIGNEAAKGSASRSAGKSGDLANTVVIVNP